MYCLANLLFFDMPLLYIILIVIQIGQRSLNSLNSLKTPGIKGQIGSLNSLFLFELLEFSLNFLNFPWNLLLNVLLNVLCWIVVPKFVWSTFAHQRSLTSVIYAHKKWFSFSDVSQLKLPFCCRDSMDIANMSKECHFRATRLTEWRFKDWLRSQPITTTAYCKLCRKIIDIKKIGMSALDLHVKSKKHKNNIATLVSATPINTHFAGMIKSQFLYVWDEFFVFGDVEWQNSLYSHSREMSTHGKNLSKTQYFSQILLLQSIS